MIEVVVTGKVIRVREFRKEGQAPVWYGTLQNVDDEGKITELKFRSDRYLNTSDMDEEFRMGITSRNVAQTRKAKDGTPFAVMEIENSFHVLQ